MRLRTKLKLLFDKEMRAAYAQRIETISEIDAMADPIMMEDCADCAHGGQYCGHPSFIAKSYGDKARGELDNMRVAKLGKEMAAEPLTDQELAAELRYHMEHMRIAAHALSEREYTVVTHDNQYKTTFLTWPMKLDCYKSSGFDSHVYL